MRMPVFGIRELRNYVRYLRYPEQSSFYLKRVEGHFPKIFQILLRIPSAQKLLASDFSWRFFENLERLIPPRRRTIRHLQNYSPDVIVASPVNLWWSEEVDYIKAGKRLGIPTAIAVLSWDNITTKGVFHEIPDLTLVWNDAHYQEALKTQIPADGMIITGAPHFDKWLTMKAAPSDYASFCARAGLDAAKPFVLYLGSSQNIAKDESWVVEALVKQLRASSDEALRQVQILVRPHPANAQGFIKIFNPTVIVWPPGGSLPDNQTDFQDFYDTLLRCKCTLGINTSGMLDALVFGKPGITLMVDRYAETQIETIHYRHLLESNALEVASNLSEAIDIIELTLRGQDSRKEDRRKFVNRFIRPRGENTPAGYATAVAIELLGSGRTSDQIEQELVEIFGRI